MVSFFPKSETRATWTSAKTYFEPPTLTSDEMGSTSKTTYSTSCLEERREVNDVRQYWSASRKQWRSVSGSSKAITLLIFVQMTIGPRFPRLAASFGGRQIKSSRQIGQISTENVCKAWKKELSLDLSSGAAATAGWITLTSAAPAHVSSGGVPVRSSNHNPLHPRLPHVSFCTEQQEQIDQITDGGGLSKAEIAKMIKDAERYKQEDEVHIKKAMAHKALND
ncbi:hypothetical protein Ccrd_000915 [Cynara cardunculus var. scolymus]|uniref:Uncharacterized protein n=1 Tax=Cynara cardunculus var. scolymus TaxID=59895 RepID=A0A103XU80_CYNCS|nr:hypothetical protein Ccrd_000915 [Cynara cardunculus var. scolymus]